jgi:hypothetical protein
VIAERLLHPLEDGSLHLGRRHHVERAGGKGCYRTG